MKPLRIAVLGMFVLAGCVGPGTLTGMNKEQIEALAKIKDAAVMCIEATVTVYQGKTVFASIDKGIIGALSVDERCKVTIDTKPVRHP